MTATQQESAGPAVEAGESSAPRTFWASYLLRRVLVGVLVLATLVIVTFAVVRLIPGDPARHIAGLDAPPERVAAVRAELGLNDSLLTQLGRYVAAVVRGDLGTSFENGQPVRELLAQRLPITLTLAACALFLVVVVGAALGIAVGMSGQDGRRAPVTRAFGLVSTAVGSIPEYILATLLVLLLSVQLRLLPAQGDLSLRGLILPVLSLAIPLTMVFARIVRAQTTQVLGEDHLLLARTRRLPVTHLVRGHILPNVLGASLSVGGIIFVALIGGAVIAESVFAMGGVGSGLVHAVLVSDYPLVQGSVLLLGVCTVVINLVVDIVLGILDPRVLR